ncbi:EVE domain-containing protein [Chloroflexia bacterium SDU3-3]|nr:EVE domain-containing protein [Chloroflexia bacterium SDU3-3]
MNGWLGVVSQAHVQRGVAGGFGQVCHGKAAPLRRMQQGDVLIYYSPTVELGGQPLKAFTALGLVEDDTIFSFDMGGGFVPFRRHVRYEHVRTVPLDAVKGTLDLCASPSWGIALRRGLLPLSKADLHTIASAMGVDLTAPRFTT